MKRRILLLAVALFGWPVAADATEVPHQTRELLSQMPLYFEPSESGFVSRSDGYLLDLTPTGAALHLRGRPSCCGQEAPTAVLRLQLVGSNPRPTLTGLGKMQSLSHYFVGGDSSQWRTGVPHFAKVKYEAVYPGVDLVYYGNQRRLEFDFLLAAGADPNKIVMEFAGAKALRLQPSGDAIAETAAGEVVLHAPVIYQEARGERAIIPGHFVLEDGLRLRFSVGPYDTAKPLVIDPVLSMASYVGASAVDIAVDKNGHVHVVGSTNRKDLATTAGVVQPSKAGDSLDIYLLKFDPEGSRILHATYLGGSEADNATGISVDADGNALITGNTFSPDFPLANATQSKLGGDADAFVAKLNPTGAGLIYSTYLGGKPRFEMEPLSIDFGRVTRGQPKDATITIRNTGTIPFSVCAGTGGGAVRFFGTTASCLTGFENEFVNFNAKITVPALSQTSFTIRFSPGGRGHDKGTISFHNGDQSIFAELPWKGEGIVPPFPPDPPPPPDAATYRNKPPLFLTSNDAYDSGSAIAVDQAGNVSIAGGTISANFPVLNAMQALSGGIDGSPLVSNKSDAFVARFSPLGQLIFSTYIGGNDYESADGVAADPVGNTYVSFNAGALTLPSTASIQPFGPSERPSTFVIKLSPAGSRVYSTVLGADAGNIAVDDSGAVFLTGSEAVGNLATPNAFQKVIKGSADAFVAKLNPSGSSLDYFTWLGGSGLEYGFAIAVDSAGSAYITGTTFSTDFPLQEPVQGTYGGGGREGFFTSGDAFVSQLSPDGSSLVFSTYFGGPGEERALGIKLTPQGRVVIAGPFAGAIPTTNPLPGFTGGGFVAMFTGGQVLREVQLWQKIEIAAPTGNDGAASFKVEFVRMINGLETRVESEILAIRPGFVTVRVPPGLLGPADVNAPLLGVDNNVRGEVLRASNRQEIARQPLILRMPQPMIVDEVDVRQGSPGLRTLLQFVFNTGSPNIHTFAFLGRSTDGVVGLRVLNSELRFPAPLSFDSNGVTIFEPGVGSAPPRRLLPFTIPNLGFGNHGGQFRVSQNGVHVIAIEPSESSPGPFPARYQFHLAGNVGLPRKLVNGAPEAPRGTRLDTLFNHSAPRPQSLTPVTGGEARTALFKFANVASVSPFARAVLLPPLGGFVSGMRIVRAADPTSPLEITTPTARTPECAVPVIGNVIDFTQIPDPASVLDPSPVFTESVCSVIGQNDGFAVTLPKTLAGGAALTSLILDMGSGHEIVDGNGADFEVLASAGSYTVQVGNTPFAGSFSAALGPFTGVRQVDLAASGLKSARYVWITPSPSLTLDAVRNLNLLADEIYPTVGPITHVTSATITARRAKASANQLDPFLQLIAPNGDLFGENEAGFGDDLTLDKNDAALLNIQLPQDGFYRYLVKGFDKQPDEQSTGAFFTRLETPGQYDQVELAVSDRDEAGTAAQKTGAISATRQRDSYLFQATPGQRVNIVLNATGAAAKLNPVVELYDPEEFLIAANDDFIGRGRNAALTVTLPPLGEARGTYRVVVSAVDEFGSTSAFNGGVAHIRQAVGGAYELKVFTGTMTGATPALVPDIDLQPTSLDFGEVPIGQSKDLTLTVANKGTGPLRVTSLATGNDQITLVSPAIPFEVAAGGQQSVVLRFTPRSAAPVTANLAVNSNDPDEAALTVPLAGQGRAADASVPRLALTPSNPRVDESLTVEFFDGPGNARDWIGIYREGQAPTGFGWLTWQYVGGSQAAGEAKKTGSVTFPNNTIPAGKWTAHLLENDGFRVLASQSFTVTEATLAPDIDLQPSTLDFGEVAVGQSKDLTLTVANKGAGPLRVTSLTTGNDQIALVSPAIPFDVAAGGQQSIVLRFTPRSAAPVTANLAVSSNDPDEANLTVPLAGKPTQPPAQAQTARARLTSLSLRFQRGQGTLLGEAVFLQLSGLFGAGAPSGELAFDADLAKPSDFLSFGGKALPSHIAAYVLEDAAGTPVSEGDLELDLPPMTDANHNGLPDFFDLNLGVSQASSKGSFFDQLGDGTLAATWNRPAGSVTGTCALRLALDLGGFPINVDVTLTFELVAYEGSLTYRPDGQAISGPLEMTLAGVQPGPELDLTLKTPLRLTRQSTDALVFQEADWTNEAGQKLFSEFFPVTRNGLHYLTAVAFGLDGNKEGFLTWMLDLADSNDTDGDGVPDLSDDATAVPPAGVEGWRAAQFAANVLADTNKEATVWGDRANPDGDLLPNLLEYLMGLSPTVADAAPLRLERTPNGLPAIVYRQAKNAPGVEAFPEWTPTLGAWRRDQVTREVISETADAMMVRATFPALANGKAGFARLAAEKR